jgi:hypothetical protein
MRLMEIMYVVLHIRSPHAGASSLPSKCLAKFLQEKRRVYEIPGIFDKTIMPHLQILFSTIPS